MSKIVLLVLAAVISVSAASEAAEQQKGVCTFSDIYYVFCGEQGSERCKRYREVDVACEDDVSQTARIVCKSRKNAYRECAVSKAYKILGLSIETEFGGSKGCDSSFGFKGTSIWVDNGCRAVFSVKITPIINGGWSRWSKWTTTKECPYLCGLRGEKAEQRSRICDNPPPSNGGADCSGDDTQTRTRTCGGRINYCRRRCKKNMFLVHKTNKYLYYMCSNNAAYLMKCAPGTVFDFSISGCNHDSSRVCTTKEDTIQVDPDDCSRYSICNNNMKMEMTCPDDTRIDPATGSCVYNTGEC